MHASLVVSDSLLPHKLPTRLRCPWNFPGKNTEVGCHFLHQRSFLTQGSNPSLSHLLHWREDYFIIVLPESMCGHQDPVLPTRDTGYASLKETALPVGVRKQTPREWTPLTPATLRSGEKHQLDRAGQKVLVLGLTQPHQQMCSWVPPNCLAPETPGPQPAMEAHPRMEINWRLRSLLTSLLVTHSSTVSDLTSHF